MTPAEAANQVERFSRFILKACIAYARRCPGLSADDLFQDSCLWVYRWSLRRDEPFGAGLIAVMVHRACIESLQKAKRQDPAFGRRASLVDRDGEDFIESGNPDVELRVEVADLLATLPPHIARRMRRYFLRGETSGEIARSEQVSGAAVRQAIAKGLRLMRQAVEG